MFTRTQEKGTIVKKKKKNLQSVMQSNYPLSIMQYILKRSWDCQLGVFHVPLL